MKKIPYKSTILSCLMFMISLLTYSQEGLVFDEVFSVSVTGEKAGVIDVVNEVGFTVSEGTVVKITSTAICEISPFDGTPNVLTNSNQGMLFVNDFPVSNVPEVQTKTVDFPIWLSAGTYDLKLVAHTNNIGKKLRGHINGITFRLE